jgi:NADH-quinone oxidoreductase subunit L
MMRWYAMRAIALIPFVPAAGAAINALIGARWFGRRAIAAVGCATMGIAFVLSAWSLAAIVSLPSDARVHDAVFGDWIPAIPLQTATGIEMFTVRWTFRLDPLSAMMAVLVTAVGFLIHLYAVAFMQDEPPGACARFFSNLSLSCAFMLMLVLAGNLLVLFVGWEGIALSSFLLIGFWPDKTRGANGMKAFIVNWLGDWGLLIAIFLAYFTFGTLDFREIAASVTSMPVETGTFGALSGICLGLWIAAIGRSAQVPLHVWLPDVLEATPPASALIQTATMLPAGVYLIARNAALFERAPVVMTIVSTLGLLTALMAGALALVQNDLKRVLAYSMVSQLGLIFTALGAGAFSAAVFHLVTLALGQLLLFVGGSTIIRTMDGERNMQRMGALRQHMPVTFVAMMVGVLALIGLPPLSGFFSVNEISAGVFANHRVLWLITSATTVLTAVYLSRLLLLTFFGSYRGAPREWPDSSSPEAPRPVVMTLMALAVASIVMGFIGVSAPGGTSSIMQLLVSTTSQPHSSLAPTVGLMLLLLSALLPLTGILIARHLSSRDPVMDLQLGTRWPAGRELLANQYFFDELYRATIVSGAMTTARTLSRFDRRVIHACVDACGWAAQIAGWTAHMMDKHIVDRIADVLVRLVGRISFLVRRIQTGLSKSSGLLVLLSLPGFASAILFAA